MARSRTTIQETYNLPSRGLLGEDIPKTVKLRAMTTMEEKMRLAGSGITLMPDIIKACIVDPDGVDTHVFPLFDISYLMYKLRTITYGSEYKITLRCPSCGQRFDVTVNLDDLEVNELPDDFKNPITIDNLPISGDTIECKILTVNDYADIETEKKRIMKKFPDYVGDPELILSVQKRIVSINGESMPEFKVKEYVENLHARDYQYIISKYNDATASLGLVTTDLMEVCPKCGSDVDFDLPITTEFFRPRY